MQEYTNETSYNDKIQFHPAGAPVPLSEENHKSRNTASCTRNGLTSHGENILCGTEAVCFGNANGKPNKAEEEVQHHEEYRKPKKQGVQARGKIINGNCEYEQPLRNSPD